MRQFLSQFIPFVFIGIALVALAFGIMLLAYLFFLGALVGIILFLVSWIRERFFAHKRQLKPKRKQSGRIIDSKDWKKW